MSNPKIIDAIISDDKNLLILDTCCLLDIIRCIQRNNFNILKSTRKIIEKFEEKKNDFFLLLPSLVKKEWDENFEIVKNDTKNFIIRHDENHLFLVKIIDLLLSESVMKLNLSEKSIENELFSLSEKIIENSFHLKVIKECKEKAIERVICNIAPSEKGKDSTKDCIIFEEVLYISSLLRNKGYKQKIVFASSNVREYFLGNSLKEKIKQDIEEYNIKIVKSLDHGYYIVDKLELY